MSVDVVLERYVAELDAAYKAARGTEPFDDSKILDLVEELVVACTSALLDELGEPRAANESPDELVARATESIRNHPEAFVEDASVKSLERELHGLHDVLRDLAYFRQGIGVLKNGHKPADMRWLTEGPMESYAVSALSRVSEALRSDLPQVHRIAPEAEVDLAHTRAGIIELLRQDLGPDEFMSAAIDLGASQTGPAGWDAFRALAYEEELEKRSSFFVDVISRNPPGAPLAGLYGEIAYPSRGGKTVADVDVTGSDTYEPDDEEWFGSITYTPRDSLAGSEVLAKIYEMAYLPGGLGNAADYTLCLAWGAYLSRACARRFVLETGSDRIGLRVGFSGGDWIELGWVVRSA